MPSLCRGGGALLVSQAARGRLPKSMQGLGFRLVLPMRQRKVGPFKPRSSVTSKKKTPGPPRGAGLMATTATVATGTQDSTRMQPGQERGQK